MYFFSDASERFISTNDGGSDNDVLIAAIVPDPVNTVNNNQHVCHVSGIYRIICQCIAPYDILLPQGSQSIKSFIKQFLFVVPAFFVRLILTGLIVKGH